MFKTQTQVTLPEATTRVLVDLEKSQRAASNSLPVELCRFELDTECDTNRDVKNVIMCKIYRKYRDGGWIFKAIGAKGMEGNACNYDPIVRLFLQR